MQFLFPPHPPRYGGSAVKTCNGLLGFFSLPTKAYKNRSAE
ncbi:hypothetical protein Nmel_001440 [Mimus melanotis]